MRPTYEARLDSHWELISVNPIHKDINAKEVKRPVKSEVNLPHFEPIHKDRRSLCLIMGWFGGRKRHLMKYAQLYLDHGVDVLMGTSSLTEIARPAFQLKDGARQLLRFLCQNRHYYDTIIVHGFSIAAAIWGEVLLLVEKNPLEYGFVRDKIKFQVWDSPFLDTDRLPEIGSLTAFPRNPWLQKHAETIVRLQMKIFKSAGLQYFERPFSAFITKNFKNPYLLYTSQKDEAAPVSTVARCAEIWQQNGSKVYWKVWESSRHVCHLRDYPSEYKGLLRLFLGFSNRRDANYGTVDLL